MNSLKTQVGGDHYKNLAIQPMEYSMANRLDACQHTIVKYVTRFRDKGGIADLEKARHTLDMLIDFERAKAAPTAANDNDPPWKAWDGGECPVNLSDTVEYMLGDSKEAHCEIAGYLRWSHIDRADDITFYRVVSNG